MATKVSEELELIIKAQTEKAKESLEEFESNVNQLADKLNEVSDANDTLEKSTEKVTTANKKESASVASLVTNYAKRALSITAIIAMLVKLEKAGEANNIANAKAAAAIKALGAETDITASQIERMAYRVAKSTGQSTANIQSAAAEILVGLNAPADKLEEYINLAADLSALWGTDLKASAKSLTEILAEPDKAMEKLRSQGIFLSDSQKELLDSMLAVNDVAGAQKIIVDSLSGSIGDVAESVNNAKGLTRLKDAFGEFFGYLGESLASSKAYQWIANGLIDETSQAKAWDFANNFVSSYKKDSEEALKSLSVEDIDFLSSFLTSDLSEYTLQQRAVFRAFTGDTRSMLKDLADRKQVLVENKEANDALKAAEEAEAIAAANAAKEKENQIAKTDALSTLYKATAKGEIESLQSQIDMLSSQRDEDQKLISSGGDATGEAAKRLAMYDEIIKSLKEKLSDLTEVKTSWEEVLGTNDIDAFVANVPISFRLDSTELSEAKDKLSVLKNSIEALYDPNNTSEEYQTNMTKLLDTYKAQLEVVTQLEEEQKTAAEDQKLAQEYRLSLLSEEEVRNDKLLNSAQEINRLNEEGLLTDEEKAQLLLNLVESEEDLQLLYEGHYLTLEQIKAKMDEIGNSSDSSEDAWKDIKKLLTDINSYAALGSSIFQKMGENLAAGKKAGEGMDEELGSFVSQLAGQLATTAIAAGLRVIAESGYAGIPVAIALFALGGVAGIGAGLMSSKGTGLDSTMMDSIKEEVSAREKLAETINQSIDEEYYLLKRQLERNLISVETFKGDAADIHSIQARNDASLAIVHAAEARINELNGKVEDMSGWSKFWSNKDENYGSTANQIARILENMSDEPSAEELDSIVKKLKKLGVNTSSIPAYAEGGSFVTNGPQLIMVGDNPSGREAVSITPLPASGNNAPAITIHIENAYGLEDLYYQLEVVGRVLNRRGQY